MKYSVAHARLPAYLVKNRIFISIKRARVDRSTSPWAQHSSREVERKKKRERRKRENVKKEREKEKKKKKFDRQPWAAIRKQTPFFLPVRRSSTFWNSKVSARFNSARAYRRERKKHGMRNFTKETLKTGPIFARNYYELAFLEKRRWID